MPRSGRLLPNLADHPWAVRIIRNPALIWCDAEYKAARGCVLTPLFELARKWPLAKAGNAVDSHHTHLSGSPVFSKQVRLARPVDFQLVGVGRVDFPSLAS